MFDETSLYSKGDRIGIYGANLKQTRSGPILIKESILNVEQPRAAVVRGRAIRMWVRRAM
jgi:hypothetical protein